LDSRNGRPFFRERRFVSILGAFREKQLAAAFPDAGVKERIRRSSNSPAKISGQFLRRLGFRVSHQERWNPHAEKRQDLFGFIDILAIHPELKITLGVQSTTAGHVMARMVKIDEECSKAALDWLRAGHRILIFGWKTMKPRGQRPYRRLTVMEVKEVDGAVSGDDSQQYTYSRVTVPGFKPWGEQREDFFRRIVA
jgi:hypothetical protein